MFDDMEAVDEFVLMNIEEIKAASATENTLWSQCYSRNFFKEVKGRVTEELDSACHHIFEVELDNSSETDSQIVNSDTFEGWAEEEERKVKAMELDIEVSMDKWVNSYEDFVIKLRKYCPNFSDFLSKRESFLDVVLNTRAHKLKLRIDLASFTLVGYQVGSEGDNKWLELGYHHTWKSCPPSREVYGSSFLDLNKRYSCLLCDIGGGLNLSNLVLGQRQLVTAVELLATSMDYLQRAWSLIVVKLMICESVRSNSIFEYLISSCPLDCSLPPALVSLVRRKEEESMYNCTFFSDMGRITDFYYIPRSNQSFLFENYIPINQFSGEQCGRRRLVEVFAVRINNIKDTYADNFFGTIFFRDNSSTLNIYFRKEENPEFVFAGDSLLLRYSSCCSPFTSCFGFCFILFGKIIPNEDYHIMWDEMSGKSDMPLFDEFTIHECSLTLSYIVLDDAVQATVEVTIKEINRPVGTVFGKISARLAKFDSHEILLFQNNNLKVYPGMLFELSKTAVAVPWGSCLLIRVEFYEIDGEEFSFGSSMFHTQVIGSSEETIFKGCSELQVKVIWK